MGGLPSHYPSNSVLAAGFTGLAQIEENARRAIHALAGLEGRADQTQQALIFNGSVREGFFQPGVVAARRDVEQSTHHPNIVVGVIGTNEFVLATNFAGFFLFGHFEPPTGWSSLSKCPLNPGNSTFVSVRASGTEPNKALSCFDIARYLER